MRREPLRRIGWGPFRMPGEKKRMAELEARYNLDHGRCLSQLAGLVAEALTHYDGLDEWAAYGIGATVANVLDANPQVMRDVLDSRPRVG